MQNTSEKKDGSGVASEWLTSAEAALYLKVERRTLLQWVRQGKATCGDSKPQTWMLCCACPPCSRLTGGSNEESTAQ